VTSNEVVGRDITLCSWCTTGGVKRANVGMKGKCLEVSMRK
jgi:hypothetical protein